MSEIEQLKKLASDPKYHHFRRVVKEIEALEAELAAARADLAALRKNIARYFVEAYSANPKVIAELCDTELDRSGALLGYVRDLYYEQRKAAQP